MILIVIIIMIIVVVVVVVIIIIMIMITRAIARWPSPRPSAGSFRTSPAETRACALRV